MDVAAAAPDRERERCEPRARLFSVVRSPFVRSYLLLSVAALLRGREEKSEGEQRAERGENGGGGGQGDSDDVGEVEGLGRWVGLGRERARVRCHNLSTTGMSPSTSA